MNVKRKTAGAKRNLPPPVLHWAGILRRDTLLFLLLLGLALASGLGVVHTAHRKTAAFNELQWLKDQALVLDVTHGQLLIEHSTFGVDGRIERRAMEQLSLRRPAPQDIVPVRRLLPPETNTAAAPETAVSDEAALSDETKEAATP